MKRRFGFTVIETLVIVGIVLLLVALLAPGLFQARERARRQWCRNNLKQLGVALQSYHAVNKLFPPGIGSWGPGRDYVLTPAARLLPGSGGTSGFTLLLPHLGQSALYASYNLDQGCIAAANVTATTATVDVLLCPANARGAGGLAIPAYPQPPAPTDYVFSLGGNALLTPESPFAFTHRTIYHHPPELKLGVGAFNVDRSIGLRWIRDGASNTFVIGEGTGGLPRGQYDGSEYGGEIPNQPHAGAVVDQAWSQGFIPTPDGVGGYGSVFAATAFDASYDIATLDLMPSDQFTPLPMNMHTRGANLMRGTTFKKGLPFSSYPNVLPVYAWMLKNVSVSPFRSQHYGKCYFLFANGHVWALDEKLDPRIYVALSSVAGKEPVEKWGW